MHACFGVAHEDLVLAQLIALLCIAVPSALLALTDSSRGKPALISEEGGRDMPVLGTI